MEQGNPLGRKAPQRWKGWLLRDQAPDLVQRAKAQLTSTLDTAAAQKEIGYPETSPARTTCGTFRQAGYFIGSGVVEAGCKTLIGKRMKNSGMFWSEAGGQGMLDLRCAFLSHRLDAFCQARATAHAPTPQAEKLDA